METHAQEWARTLAPAVVQGEGGPVLVPSLVLSLYLDAVSPGRVADFIHKGASLLGDRIQWIQTDSMKKASAFDEEKLSAKLERLLSRPRSDKIATLSLTDRDTFSAPSAFVSAIVDSARLEPLRAPERDRTKERAVARSGREPRVNHGALLTAGVPIDHPAANPGQMVSWVSHLDLVRAGDFICGACAPTLSMTESAFGSDLEQQQAIAAGLLRRHPGLDIVPPFAERVIAYDPQRDRFRYLIRRVNWLTLLASSTLQDLGGREAFDAGTALVMGAEKTHLGAGALLIRVTPEPRIGDVSRGDRVAEYGRLARYLRPVRVSEPYLRSVHFESPRAGEEWFFATDQGDRRPGS